MQPLSRTNVTHLSFVPRNCPGCGPGFTFTGACFNQRIVDFFDDHSTWSSTRGLAQRPPRRRCFVSTILGIRPVVLNRLLVESSTFFQRLREFRGQTATYRAARSFAAVVQSWTTVK